jgi:hypothetical protein
MRPGKMSPCGDTESGRVWKIRTKQMDKVDCGCRQMATGESVYLPGKRDPDWQTALKRPNITIQSIAGAHPTFPKRIVREQVNHAAHDWMTIRILKR